jgi:hypothetical protein
LPEVSKLVAFAEEAFNPVTRMGSPETPIVSSASRRFG